MWLTPEIQLKLSISDTETGTGPYMAFIETDHMGGGGGWVGGRATLNVTWRYVTTSTITHLLCYDAIRNSILNAL